MTGSGFERVLAGLDGRDGGRDALALARNLADPFDAEVVEVSVDPETYGDSSPARVLSELAESGEGDLIVVGSPHRGALGRVLIGSVAMSLLHGAACPVAVAPRGYASAESNRPLKTVAVAYDGTDEAKVALHRAEGIALAAGATLRLLTVVRPAQGAAIPGAAGYGYVAEAPLDPEKALSQGMDSVSQELHVEGQRLDGPPAKTLATACEDGVDLIVAGSRGYGPAMRVLLGSVSAELARTAPCPVLVTQRG